MSNNFPPNEGARIPVAEAKAMIQRYDDENRLDKANDTTSVFFGREAIEKLLKDYPKASGISIFLAKEAKGEITFVLVPRDENGTLIWADAGQALAAESSTLDFGRRCPPVC